MEQWMQIAGLIAVLLLVLIGVYVIRRRRSGRAIAEDEAKPVTPLPTERVPVTPAPIVAPEGQPLGQRLSRTRGALLGGLSKFFGRSGGAMQSQEWEELEEALLAGDVGFTTASALLSRVKGRIKNADGKGLRDLIEEESLTLFDGLSHGTSGLGAAKPLVISIVGVNGVGKTTTIGKLAQKFITDGKTVLMGAGDTFRAAAISQLKIWADRTGAQFVTGREGADPGAVAFDSVAAGKAREVDIVLLDTAGRLHTKTNLMEELKKVHRVIKKVIPEAPHEVWLVIDGTLGQNSIAQAREFQKTLDLTGVIITKLDGTAKGGAVLAIASELKLPIRFIGVGEKAEDLIPFEPKPFVEAILGA